MKDIDVIIREKIILIALDKGYNYEERGVLTKMAKDIIMSSPTVLMKKKDDIEFKEYPRSLHSTRQTLTNFFKTEKTYTSDTLTLICKLLDVENITFLFKNQK